MGKSQQASIIGFVVLFTGLFLPAVDGVYGNAGLIAVKASLVLIGMAIIAVLFSFRQRFGLQVFFSILSLALLAFMLIGLDVAASETGKSLGQVLIPWGWLGTVCGVLTILAAPVLDNY